MPAPDPHPGQRLVVRHRLPDGRATDTVGRLVRAESGHLVLVSRGGTETTIDRALVIAIKIVPGVSRGPAPTRTSAVELEHVAALAWVDHAEPLGEWWLRAAAGFTARANSVLAVGDPDRPWPDAAAAVIAFAAAHGIDPMAQVIMDSEVDQQLQRLGWVPTYATVEVLVQRLSDLVPEQPVAEVTITEDLTDAWLAAYQRHRPGPESTVRRLLAGGALAMITDAAGRAIAIGRAHHTASWVGIAALWTDPGHRRRGHATTIMIELGRWAADRGARNAYLQVDRVNTVALTAYAHRGFVPHHTYRYLTPPA